MASSERVAAGKGREKLAKRENKGSVLEFAGPGLLLTPGFRQLSSRLLISASVKRDARSTL
jgi:hypothetical protein